MPLLDHCSKWLLGQEDVAISYCGRSVIEIEKIVRIDLALLIPA